MTTSQSLKPDDPDLYVRWTRLTQPHSPEERAEAERLMAYVRGQWLPAAKIPDREQVRYFQELDARADRLPPEHLPYFWDGVSHLLSGWHSTGAYRRARQAEAAHGLPVDADHLVANALLLTRRVGLGAGEQDRHLRWLRQALPADRAHRETARFVEETAAHNYLQPPETLPELIRATAGAAGLGPEEDTRLLGELLKGECARRACEALLSAVAKAFVLAPPDDTVRERLLGLYTDTHSSRSNGKGLLRLLVDSGAFEAMRAGRLVPEDGCAGWLTGFVDAYTYYLTPQGTMRGQTMPTELHPLLRKLAGPLKEAGDPVRLHCSQHGRVMDALLAETCLESGVAVVDPGPGAGLYVHPRRKSTYEHLRAHPVLGPRTTHIPFDRPGFKGHLT